MEPSADAADSRSQVSLRCAVRRAKEGSELTVQGVTVRPDSTGSQAARSFPHGTGEDPEALGGE